MSSSNADQLFLWDTAVSSYAQKVRIALREKGIPFKSVIPEAIKTGHAEDEFRDTNPRLEVPALIDGDLKIFDSTIIIEYLEDKWPEPPIFPRDPASRAKARMIEDVCDTQYEAINWGWGEVNWFERATGELADKLKTEVVQQTKTMQAWLTEQLGSADYFNGETFGVADAAAAPIVNRSSYYGFGPEEGSPLALWLLRIRERESVKTTFAEFEGAVGNMPKLSPAFKSGQRKREYRDHRLEWLVKSGGIDVVIEGLKANNVKFSWPHAKS